MLPHGILIIYPNVLPSLSFCKKSSPVLCKKKSMSARTLTSFAGVHKRIFLDPCGAYGSCFFKVEFSHLLCHTLSFHTSYPSLIRSSIHLACISRFSFSGSLVPFSPVILEPKADFFEQAQYSHSNEKPQRVSSIGIGLLVVFFQGSFLMFYLTHRPCTDALFSFQIVKTPLISNYLRPSHFELFTPLSFRSVNTLLISSWYHSSHFEPAPLFTFQIRTARLISNQHHSSHFESVPLL